MPTVATLDDRVDTFEKTFADFRGRMDTVISILRWASAMGVATLIAVLFQLMAVAREAGRLEGKFDAQAERVTKLTEVVEKQGAQIQLIANKLERIEARMDAKFEAQGDQIQKLSGAVAKQGEQIQKLSETLAKRGEQIDQLRADVAEIKAAVVKPAPPPK